MPHVLEAPLFEKLATAPQAAWIGSRAKSKSYIYISRKRNPSSLAVNQAPDIVTHKNRDNCRVSIEPLLKSWLNSLELKQE
jgi:hypothetical protein